MLQRKYSGSLYSISGPSVGPKKRNTPTRHWSAQVHRREEIFSSKNFFFRKRMKHALFLTSTDDAYSNMSLLFTQICWHSYIRFNFDGLILVFFCVCVCVIVPCADQEVIAHELSLVMKSDLLPSLEVFTWTLFVKRKDSQFWVQGFPYKYKPNMIWNLVY